MNAHELTANTTYHIVVKAGPVAVQYFFNVTVVRASIDHDSTTSGHICGGEIMYHHFGVGLADFSSVNYTAGDSLQITWNVQSSTSTATLLLAESYNYYPLRPSLPAHALGVWRQRYPSAPPARVHAHALCPWLRARRRNESPLRLCVSQTSIRASL